MASTPVRAAQPDANAFSRSSAPTDVALSARTEAWPEAVTVLTGAERSRPAPIRAKTEPTNTAVGTMNTFADSTIPRRLTPVITTRTARHSHSRCPYREGNAEVRAATPAVTATATFRT